MNISKIYKYLITRYSIGGIIAALLFTFMFLIFNYFDNSLQKNNLILKNISSVQDSVYQIKQQFQFYVNEKNIPKRNILKRKLDRQFADIRNNTIVRELTLNESINSILSFKSQLNNLKREIQSITITYRRLSAEAEMKLQRQYFGLINEHIMNIHYALNQLSLLLTTDIQRLVSDFSKYNLLVWIAAMLSLHFIIILVFKPTASKIISVIEDLNKEKDEAHTIARAKSDYLATLSYQIRTPLNGVLGLSGLLLETNVDKEQREYLELVKDSGENLLQVINDIFDFSKIETGNFELEENYFSLNQCVEEIVKTYLPRCQEKKLELVHIIEHDVPEYIFGDSQRLKQCLSNLISNAVKFTRKGEIFIRVNLLNSFDNKHEIQFAVSDTGMGIPEANLNNLFNPAPQAKSPVGRKFQSTGLGLAIVSRIVQLMNGRIWVESEMNTGTSFYIAINFLGQEAGVDIKNEKDIKILNQKHVVILNNNDDSRKSLSIQCHNWGMQPKSFNDIDDFNVFIKNQQHADYFILDYKFISNNPEMLNKIKEAKVYHSTAIIYTHSIKIEVPEMENLIFLAEPIDKAGFLNIFLRHAAIHDKKSINTFDTPVKKTKLNLLLAEDNAINQKLMQRMVEQLEHNLDLAHNGKQAVKLASQNNYDIIFMDLQMPQIDGLEATKKILQNSEEPKPKIVAISANAHQKDKELCFEAGMIDYLVKPIGFDDIKSILNYWANKTSRTDIKKPANHAG